MSFACENPLIARTEKNKIERIDFVFMRNKIVD
jgi:hypothetical protein